MDVTQDVKARTLPRHSIDIFLVSFAALLLEVNYTRIISYKIFFYYTYLVLGLALLGIGFGGVLVALSPRLRHAKIEAILRKSASLGAAVIAVGYVVIAVLPLDTVRIWDYGTVASFKNLALLLLICLVLFSAFVAIGVMISTILGRGGSGIGRLYFMDLVGAGLACGLAVYLESILSPPGAVFLSAAILAMVALHYTSREHRRSTAVGGALALGMAVLAVLPGLLPDPVPETSKQVFYSKSSSKSLAAEWGPVFRVDVVEKRAEDRKPSIDGSDAKWLIHDGLIGSVISKWDGDRTTLGRFEFDTRSVPFKTVGVKAPATLIIGAAGGHEILASLFFNASKIDAVELNPVTVDLVKNKFADYVGNLADQPSVNYVQGDGRTFIARSKERYDIIYFVAPDSYAATNAASSGAFVLSESYLYTKEMVRKSLEHLTNDGVVTVEFGEYDYAAKPSRTVRYLQNVRAALSEMGIAHPERHVVVMTTDDFIQTTTMLIKRTEFTANELARYEIQRARIPGSTARVAPGMAADGSPVSNAVLLRGSALTSFLDSYPDDVSVVTDDRPFLWHFRPFNEVFTDMTRPLSFHEGANRENGVGERVLLLLLFISIAFAAVFLLLPFLRHRGSLSELPSKGLAAVYFASLGLGFMFYEITMIQKLSLFLGYPTYSLTITLAAVLVFSGIGSLLSSKVKHAGRTVGLLWAALVVLGVFYRFALPSITESLLPSSLAVRILVTIVMLVPLGLCLGMFMPLGLSAVTSMTEHRELYVAWGWAINGFFSVIGSTLTTILSMTFGFQFMFLLAVCVYAVATLAFVRLDRTANLAR
ncbi:MAG: hypothetical protein WBD02_03990 [Acidimicrobiia bacterium]